MTSEITAGARLHKRLANTPNANPTAHQRVELRGVPENEHPGNLRARQRLEPQTLVQPLFH
jgi:hypothetical protein